MTADDRCFAASRGLAAAWTLDTLGLIPVCRGPMARARGLVRSADEPKLFWARFALLRGADAVAVRSGGRGTPRRGDGPGAAVGVPPRIGGQPTARIGSEAIGVVDPRHRRAHQAAGERESRRLSQTAVAARMGTSQSAVARLEAGDVDVRFSTVERYATALGVRLRWRIEPERSARQAPAPPADSR